MPWHICNRFRNAGSSNIVGHRPTLQLVQIATTWCFFKFPMINKTFTRFVLGDYFLTLRLATKVTSLTFVAFDTIWMVTSFSSRVWIFSIFNFIISSDFTFIIGLDRSFSVLLGIHSVLLKPYSQWRAFCHWIQSCSRFWYDSEYQAFVQTSWQEIQLVHSCLNYRWCSDHQ